MKGKKIKIKVRVKTSKEKVVKRELAKETVKKTVRKPVARPKAVKKTVGKKSQKRTKGPVPVKTEMAAKRETKTTTKKVSSGYTAKDIFVLKGLEPVRKRPGMYIGSTGIEGLHHLLKEVVGNGIDEALMGYCNKIEVRLLSDNRVSVYDNGRGIPVDKHKVTKKPALETIMTTLHSGAKFGGKAYASTGGLHGIGLAAVCALSEHARVDVFRDGQSYWQEYSRGKSITKLEKGAKTKKTGSVITFAPDPKIFPRIEWQPKKILRYLRQQAFLTKGVKIIFCDESGGKPTSYTFYFENGLTSYVRHLTRGRSPRHENIFYVQEKRDETIVEAALLYTKEFESFEGSFANNVFTPEGGYHSTGLRMAITRTLNDYAKRENFIKKESEALTGRDTREGLTVIVSVKIKEPQFEGQTKKKLGNPEIRGVVNEVVSEAFADFLEINRKDARSIIESCLLAQKARSAAKKARQTIFKRGISRFLALPGKLADCSSRSPEKSELYILEGPSAGGSAKQGRDRRFQAILPLRGKILNVEKARLDKILTSGEVKAIIIALGTSIGEEFDLKKLRYHRVIIMSDADSDGGHITTLLLTLFFRHFRPIIEAGYLYVAQPPLYSIQAGKTVQYAYSDKEKDKVVKGLEEKGVKSIHLQRYKGLGEMNPEQLWETTMDPENRILYQVTIEDGEEADRIFDVLMGSEVAPRKKFIQIHAKGVENLDV